ncbi:hypothetical protein CR513_06461, partial [Mucuna pruriens]
MTKILERYRECTKDVPANKFGDDYIQNGLRMSWSYLVYGDCASSATTLCVEALLKDKVSSANCNKEISIPPLPTLNPRKQL